MSKTITLKYTPQTPTRMFLLFVSMSFLTYAVEHLDRLTEMNTIMAFAFGLTAILFRELVSNGDHFQEFMNHMNENYEIVPKSTDDNEPAGYE